jgi:hypothetical protein
MHYKYNDYSVILSMAFWETSGYKYVDLVDLPTEKLLFLINSMTRHNLIDWLSWNDRNGVYNDEQSMRELGNLMTREEGVEIMIRQIEESRAIS